MNAPAHFIGMQEGFGICQDFALYNLTADIPGHPCGSTVGEQTLIDHGYELPPRNPVQRARQARKDSFSANPFTK